MHWKPLLMHEVLISFRADTCYIFFKKLDCYLRSNFSSKAVGKNVIFLKCNSWTKVYRERSRLLETVSLTEVLLNSLHKLQQLMGFIQISNKLFKIIEI